VRDSRRALLIAALGFAQISAPAASLRALRSWLDDWTGVGHVVVGMERQGFAVSLGKIHGDGWRASFHRDPMTSAAGFATADTPWRAVQRAAWGALKKL